MSEMTREQLEEMLSTAIQILDQSLEEKDNFDETEEKQDVADALNLLVAVSTEHADALLKLLNKG